MRRLLYPIIIIFIFSGCAFKPEIIRQVLPEQGPDLEIKNSRVKQTQDGISISLRYINKIELREMAEENNADFEDDTLLLTPFQIIIENQRSEKIILDMNKARLQDGLGNEYKVLSYEAFKKLYPSSIYQRYEYAFVFDRYYREAFLKNSGKYRNKAGRIMFKGSNISSGLIVEGILPFENISERAKNITLIIPEVLVPADNNKEKKDKEISFKFVFHQKIVRIE